MPDAIVREVLLLLGCGFVPTLESLSKVRWTHPALPNDVETTETASAICRSVGAQFADRANDHA